MAEGKKGPGGFLDMMGQVVMRKGNKEGGRTLCTVREDEREDRIKDMHDWIALLCDPEENLCEDLNRQLGWDWQGEEGGEEGEERRWVATISLDGIIGPEEIG